MARALALAAALLACAAAFEGWEGEHKHRHEWTFEEYRDHKHHGDIPNSMFSGMRHLPEMKEHLHAMRAANGHPPPPPGPLPEISREEYDEFIANEHAAHKECAAR